MDKIKYETPVAKSIFFTSADVITSSPFEGVEVELDEVPLP